jgi:hypothetical protein
VVNARSVVKITIEKQPALNKQNSGVMVISKAGFSHGCLEDALYALYCAFNLCAGIEKCTVACVPVL